MPATIGEFYSIPMVDQFGNFNLAVDGSVSPVEFGSIPYPNLVLDLQQINFAAESTRAITGSGFLGLASGLPNGLKVSWRSSQSGKEIEFTKRRTVQRDVDLALQGGCQMKVTGKLMAMTIDYANMLGADEGLTFHPWEQLFITVQDDLTHLSYFYVNLIGRLYRDGVGRLPAAPSF
ncbi:MAG: hypothetical protein ACYSWO_21785 [Planctomycetota bacterium]|jgi:hypothetical protein